MTRPDLAETLARAVPGPPPLAGLAARAEADARRHRARRRTAVGAGVLAVGAVVASLAVGSQPPDPVADDPGVPTPAEAARCRAEAPQRGPVGTVEPVSVRFCPIAERQAFRAALVPDVALTTDVQATVDALDETVRTAARAFCIDERNPYRIQIVHADGSVRDLSTQDCANGYPILLGAIGRQEAPAVDLDVPPLECPVPTVDDRGPAAALPSDAGPELLRLPAVDALQCSRQADVTVSGRVRDPEALRADLLSSYRPGMVDCSTDPLGTVTSWTLRLADGSLHTAVIDGRACSPLTVDDEYVGLAGALLARRATDPGG